MEITKSKELKHLDYKISLALEVSQQALFRVIRYGTFGLS